MPEFDLAQVPEFDLERVPEFDLERVPEFDKDSSLIWGRIILDSLMSMEQSLLPLIVLGKKRWGGVAKLFFVSSAWLPGLCSSFLVEAALLLVSSFSFLVSTNQPQSGTAAAAVVVIAAAAAAVVEIAAAAAVIVASLAASVKERGCGARIDGLRMGGRFSCEGSLGPSYTHVDEVDVRDRESSRERGEKGETGSSASSKSPKSRMLESRLKPQLSRAAGCTGAE